MAKMNLVRFSVLTFLGSLPWCFALTYAGFALGPNWESITGIFRGLDVLIVLAVILIVVWYLLRRRRMRVKAQEE
jgi:membrane protein DedA with SNARE-associated domain